MGLNLLEFFWGKFAWLLQDGIWNEGFSTIVHQGDVVDGTAFRLGFAHCPGDVLGDDCHSGGMTGSVWILGIDEVGEDLHGFLGDLLLMLDLMRRNDVVQDGSDISGGKEDKDDSKMTIDDTGIAI
jgi:hypothetical protein